MSSPREIIANALANPDRENWSWLGMADAVIDALEGMDVTAKMWGAGVEAANAGGVEEIWFAMVRAMKEDD